jgi:hypothetical protein
MSNNITMQPHKDNVYIRRLAKTIALVSMGGLSLGPESASATVLGPLGEQITNSDFGTNATPSLAGWAKTVNAVSNNNTAGTNNLPGPINARPSTDTINTSTGSAGFNNAFDSAFAVLGDQTDTITAGGDTVTSNDYALTQQFTLASSAGSNGSLVLHYDLVLTFKSVFNGVDTSSPFDDIFTVQLLDQNSDAIYTLGRASTGNFPTGQYITEDLYDEQDINGYTSFSILGVLPGTYSLQFRLVENSSTSTNTAVGIDEVSVTGVIYTPEPGLLSLLGIGFGALGWSRRRSA